MMNNKLLAMLRNYQIDNGIEPENNDKCLEQFNKIFEPYCIT